MNIIDRISIFLSTGFGVSLLYARFQERSSYIKERRQLFRGTGAGFFGTLEAAAMVALGLRFEGWSGALVLVGLTAASAYLSGRAERLLGAKDDSRIVLDEIIGYFWSVAFLPLDLFEPGPRYGILILAFVLFRIFDVYKIPSKQIQEIKGGWGIMMDDVLSGLLACVLLHGGVRMFL